MALWTLHGNGTLEPGAVVAPEERLGWGKMFGLGAQHVVAMFGATFLVPLITGFPIPATLFFSGLGTILFLVITQNKLPSYLGSSFAFISPVLASKVNGDIGKALFGIMLTGILLAIVGAVVHLAGSQLDRRADAAGDDRHHRDADRLQPRRRRLGQGQQVRLLGRTRSPAGSP